jgi:hypothetical protein
MKNRKIAFDGHTGEWVGKKVDIKSSTTYMLSGGKLKTRKAIVDKLSEFFNVPVSDISGLSIYKELKDSGWVYYASSSPLDDISRINPIERKHNYYASYRQSVKKWPVIVDFLATEVGIIAFLVFAYYAHLPFALFFFSMLGAFFSSTGNLAYKMNDWENPDIKTTIQISNQNMITDSDFTKLSPTRFIVNRLGRWFRHESVIKIGDRLYSHSSPCKDELMYSDEEAIDFVRDSAEISNHYINEVKYEPVDDAIIVVESTAEANESNVLRKDIIDRARKELPEHSPILKVISTMVNDHEVDLATLAKLEASLHQLDKKVENVASMNVEQQSVQAD